MKESTQKVLTWGAWIIILLLLSIYFALDSTYDTRPLLFKFGVELWNIGLPYLFFTFFYVLAFTMKKYWNMLFLLGIDIICMMLIVGGIYWFYEGNELGLFATVLFVSFGILKTLVVVLKNKFTKA